LSILNPGGGLEGGDDVGPPSRVCQSTGGTKAAFLHGILSFGPGGFFHPPSPPAFSLEKVERHRAKSMVMATLKQGRPPQGGDPVERFPVYFIGAGPGDPRFLTREGADALRRSLSVYALEPYPSAFSRLLRGKEVADPRRFAFAPLVRRVTRQLANRPVAFLVPGDLTVFSPFMPLVRRFGSRARVIAGVGVVNAAAALLGSSIEHPPQSRCVVLASPRHLPPGKKGEDVLLRLAALPGTLVLYMARPPLRETAALLARAKGWGCPVAVFHRVGMSGERWWRGTLRDIARRVGKDDPLAPRGTGSSLTLLIAGEGIPVRATAGEWDRRKRAVWDKVPE